jgi:hypothetical protein
MQFRLYKYLILVDRNFHVFIINSFFINFRLNIITFLPNQVIEIL